MTNATLRWRAMIEAEHAQSERMRGEAPPQDHWQPYAQHFVADPHRPDDPLVERLLREIAPHHTVIDVGAGAGRLALPLALRCRRVMAVEPSPTMASVLLQQAAEYGIGNLSLVQAPWDDAEVEPRDIVLCAHVLYTVKDIEPFVRKLEAHARDRVLVILFVAPPQSQIYPLWERIHGEERLPLPGLPEFQEVLEELGIDAEVEILPAVPHRGYDGLNEALGQLARQLYLAPGSPEAHVLEELLPDLVEEDHGTLRIRGAQPLEPGLLWWRSARDSVVPKAQG